jgi:molybdopterin-synthase adenylyltransferase
LGVTIELSDSERERYAARIEDGEGPERQLRLKGARAIVIGAGAAGSAAAAQLASSGVGYVAVVDGAAVALRDLAGQAIYYTPDVGRSKADTLAGKLGLLNPEVQVDSYPVALEEQNAAAIAESHDVVLDCTHDPAVRASLEAAGVTVLRSKPGQAAGAVLGDEALEALLGSRAGALT